MGLLDSLKSKGKDLLKDEKTKNYATKAINELSDQIDKKSGIEDDDSDELNYMINKPFEMAMVYEGTGIGDGIESVEIIQKAEIKNI